MNLQSDRKQPVSEIEDTVYLDMFYLVMSFLIIIGSIYFTIDLFSISILKAGLSIFFLPFSIFVFIHRFTRLTKSNS